MTVDAVGQSGVQLFVDAGRPVDSELVTALVREVLAEKISAMFAERLELERQHTATTQHPAQRDTVTPALHHRAVCYAAYFHTRTYTWTPLLTCTSLVIVMIQHFVLH